MGSPQTHAMMALSVSLTMMLPPQALRDGVSVELCPVRGSPPQHQDASEAGGLFPDEPQAAELAAPALLKLNVQETRGRGLRPLPTLGLLARFA